MGHYDENRRFDEEFRQANDRTKRHPIEKKINTVQIRVEHLRPQTFTQWTDGLKWVLDTMNVGIDCPAGIGKVAASAQDIHEFLQSYPHPVGTFYLIADLRVAVRMIENNPTRDICVLLVPT